MTTTADGSLDGRVSLQPVIAKPVASLAATIDRWIYVFMAGLFMVTVLVGFIPVSLDKIAAVEAGRRPPFPPVLHVHAVLMGTWIALLLTQAGLVATGRRTLHW